MAVEIATGQLGHGSQSHHSGIERDPGWSADGAERPSQSHHSGIERHEGTIGAVDEVLGPNRTTVGLKVGQPEGLLAEEY